MQHTITAITLNIRIIYLIILYLFLLQYNDNTLCLGSFINYSLSRRYHRNQPLPYHYLNNNRKSLPSSWIKMYNTKKYKDDSDSNNNELSSSSSAKEKKTLQTPKNSNEEDEYFNKDKTFLERTKRLVVLIDDEESIRLAVGDFLYDEGYQVTACADADAFLDLFTSNSHGELPSIPDVIISDVRMPGKDGLELVTLLRADERLSRVPVVLLTAKTLTKDRIEGYKAGANVYLPKPFNPDELLAIIDNLITRRNQMTSSTTNGKILDLQSEMADIKFLLKQNAQTVVQATDIYLTPVEQQVLELLSNGCTNGEIATERGVGKTWVNRTIQNLYLKTGAKTRTELVRWGMKTGQISREQD